MPEPAVPPTGTQQVLDQVARGAAAGGSVGPRLRAAREARAMSVADAAQSLKLGPRQVEALENEDWSALPGNTMIRGFVRNYARLLGLDCDALMRALDAAHLERTVQLEVSAGTSATLPQPGARVERRDYLTIIGGLLLVGLAVLAYITVPADFWRTQMSILLKWRSAPPPSVAEPQQAPPAPASIAQSSPSPAPPPATGSGEAPGPGQSVTVLAAPNAVVLSEGLAAKPSASSAPGLTALSLSFREPGWAEVRDARGQIVFSGVSAAGSSREISGQPPFSLVVGNAAHVSVHYQGRMIDLAAHSKGDVARLTLE